MRYHQCWSQLVQKTSRLTTSQSSPAPSQGFPHHTVAASPAGRAASYAAPTAVAAASAEDKPASDKCEALSSATGSQLDDSCRNRECASLAQAEPLYAPVIFAVATTAAGQTSFRRSSSVVERATEGIPRGEGAAAAVALPSEEQAQLSVFVQMEYFELTLQRFIREGRTLRISDVWRLFMQVSASTASVTNTVAAAVPAYKTVATSFACCPLSIHLPTTVTIAAFGGVAAVAVLLQTYLTPHCCTL